MLSLVFLAVKDSKSLMCVTVTKLFFDYQTHMTNNH